MKWHCPVMWDTFTTLCDLCLSTIEWQWIVSGAQITEAKVGEKMHLGVSESDTIISNHHSLHHQWHHLAIIPPCCCLQTQEPGQILLIVLGPNRQQRTLMYWKQTVSKDAYYMKMQNFLQLTLHCTIADIHHICLNGCDPQWV